MISGFDKMTMNVVAAHGSPERAMFDIKEMVDESGVYPNTDTFDNVVEDIALDAARLIIEYAPDQLKDRFDLACAHHLLREQLVDAVKNGSSTLMIDIQRDILRLLTIRD